LKKSAASLKKLVSQEQVFWDETVGVRSNHWLMQASRGDSGFFINYGFVDGKDSIMERHILTNLCRFFF
jgi:hypothetical protein